MRVSSANLYELHFNQETPKSTIYAICAYGYKLCYDKSLASGDKTHVLSGLFNRRTCYRSKATENKIDDICIDEINKKCIVCLPYGIHTVYFNKEQITIDIREQGSPLISAQGKIFVNKLVRLHTRCSLDLLLDFVRESLKFFKKMVLDADENNTDIKCWLYDDGYWESLNHHSPRDISTIYLETDKKDKLIQNIKDFLDDKTKKRYSELGLRYKRNYLFAGYPGTGKSSLAFALASYLKMDLGIINFASNLNDATLAKALKDIPSNTILLLEDIDSLFNPDRKTDDLNNMITFSGLLNCLDGIFYKEALITILTTNYKKKLDNALKRPGRIDFVMDFDYSTKEEIKMMFTKFYPSKAVADYNRFYKKIAYSKVTMSTVQEYFLEHMDGENILEDVDKLIKRSQTIKYDQEMEHLYT